MASSLSKDHGAARFPNLVELSFRLNRDSRGDPLHSEGMRQAKKPRIEGASAASSNVDAEQRPSPTRALEVSEILTHIFGYLAREQVDLVQLSTVNKQFRSAALPLLVRDLDVPLSRVPEFVDLLEANPSLFRFVRSIQLRDEEAELVQRARLYGQPRFLPERQEREHSVLPSGDTREDRDNSDVRWLPVQDLMRAISDQWKSELPPLDLGFGIRSAPDFSVWTQSHPGTAPITALRVIADHDRASETAEHLLDLGPYVGECYDRWGQLGDTIEKVFSARRPLSTLQLESYFHPFYSELSRVPESIWQTMTSHLSPTITTLTIRIEGEADDRRWLRPFTSGSWPALRVLNIKTGDSGSWPEPGHGASIDDFLTRHPQLEEIWVEGSDYFNQPSFSQVFPKLRKFYFCSAPALALVAFIDRHADTLVELAFSGEFNSQQISHRLRKALPQLRILRAAPLVVAAILDSRRAPQLSQIEFSTVGMLSQTELDWTKHRASAVKLTCLDIELYADHFDAIVKKGGQEFGAHILPNLAELSVCFQRDMPEVLQSEQAAASTLALLFRHIRPATALRALRIERPDSRPFSSSTKLEFAPNEVPPALEYFTWHSPDFNRTQHFRVVAATVPVDSRQEACLRPGGPTTRNVKRLQLLPPSFRAKISESGEWVHPSDLRHANILFDHTQSPPRLP
ncbi:hypothetical protein OC842_003762 [Tilletia horrida]|uniref:F-box domain-containing protein n=1 Tax=Tilletia horrida TaxID=155126 RepID=A0AAN6JKV4_9BASI|nr:hypothetical protein OC842_003762 [Tilletia horrida]